MDTDTIFSALSGGETIVGKYRGSDRSNMMKAIIVLTNYRLLIRWKGTTCLCFTRSSYSSIILDSIDRIDDMRPNEEFGIIMILVLLAGIASTTCGFLVEQPWLRPGGIIVIIFALLVLLCLWFGNKKKYITLKGSFGSETMIFEKTIANEFEQQLSEMIHQRRIQSFKQTEYNGSDLSSAAPMPSRHMIDTEMKITKNFAYSPLPNVA
ncbi:hypothetical protein I4U23_017238 [Adineta vaga]|nr:hypothetical protein I4U23_017238 [Adineta vaga]